MRFTVLLQVISLMALQACSTKTSDTAFSESKDVKMLIGTFTEEGSTGGIYSATFDPTNGEISKLKLSAESLSPSYLTLNKTKSLVYAIDKSDQGTISAYKRQGDTLLLINEKTAVGIPCYVDINGGETMAATANYSSGNGAVFSLLINGAIGDTLFTFQHAGNGPNKKRQETAHAHCAIFSTDGRYVYVVDLGIDAVIAYPTSGENLGKGFVALQLSPGDGPRHLIFHPTKPQAFIINELSNSIASLAVDQVSGKFSMINRKSTIPEDFKEHSQCADIHLSSDGRFLYGSNRGHNSIAIFSVDEEGGLERLGTEPVQGKWPRNFNFSPDEKYLLVANAHSDNITVFSRDEESGLLSFTGNELSVSQPVCIKF